MGEGYYDDLDARYTRGDLPPETGWGPIQRGDEAVAAGQAILMRATGTSSIDEAMAVALGRPRRTAVPTTTVKAVMPLPLAHRVRDLARRRNVSIGQILRSAVVAYLSADSATGERSGVDAA